MSSIAFPWPNIPGKSDQPDWTGHEFRIGAVRTGVLSYHNTTSGWSEELTTFHEETAGERHPIDIASRQHALRQLGRHIPCANPTILEIGCSSGFMLRDMRRKFPKAQIIGSDYIRSPLDNLADHLPGVPLLQFDMTQCPLPSGSIDAIVSLNVFEHIEKDVAALEHCHRVLKPGGVIVMEVPAGPHLYDAYDRVLLHHRRYRLNELCDKIHSVGFDVVDGSHLGFFVYPAFRAVKRRNQRKISSGEEDKLTVQKRINDTGESRLLSLVMQIELALGRWISYPFGVRCLVTARKPQV